MQCPICNGPLEDVSTKSRRMKCPACRHVFDKTQLNDYYGITSVDEGRGPHDYETSHMHATEKPHYNRPDAVPKKMTASNVPAPNASPIAPGSIVQTAANQVRQITQSAPPPNAPRPDGSFMIGGSQPPAGRPTPPAAGITPGAMRLIIWVIVIIFVFPMVIEAIGCAATLMDNNGTWSAIENSNSSKRSNSNATTNSRNRNAAVNANAGQDSSANATRTSSINIPLDDYHIKLSGAAVENDSYDKPCLVLTFSWNNPSDGEKYFAGIGMTSATQGAARLEQEYYISSTSGFDSLTAHDNVPPKASGTAQYAFKLANLTDDVVVDLSHFDSQDDYRARISLTPDGKAQVVEEGVAVKSGS